MSSAFKSIFSEDMPTVKELIISEGRPIDDVARTITDEVSEEAVKKGDAFAKEIIDLFKAKEDVEIIASDICRLSDEFEAAIDLFEKENVDSIVTLHLAYSPSLESEKALKNTKLPIIILDTTPNFDFTGDDDTISISYNHGIHGVQDMCNLLVRNNKEFFIFNSWWHIRLS